MPRNGWKKETIEWIREYTFEEEAKKRRRQIMKEYKPSVDLQKIERDKRCRKRVELKINFFILIN